MERGTLTQSWIVIGILAFADSAIAGSSVEDQVKKLSELCNQIEAQLNRYVYYVKKEESGGGANMGQAWIKGVVAATEVSAQQDKQSNAANPDKGKFGPTLLRIAARYSINRDDYGTRLSMRDCGFIDLKGNIVIEPRWDEAEDFFDGYAAVKQNEKWGWIDKSGLHVEPPVEPDIYHTFPYLTFKEGFASFKRNGKMGFLDRCKVAIELQFEEADNFSEGLAAAKQNGKWGFIDHAGKFVIEARWEEALEFHEGLAGIKENGKWGYIDKSGRVVIKPQWDRTYGFACGVAMACREKKCGLIDKTDRTIVPLEWDNVEPLSCAEGLALAIRNEKYGFIDLRGNVVSEPQWDYASFGFTDGIATVKRNDKWSCIDKFGKVIIEPQFENMSDFRAGLPPVKRNGKFGMIDHNQRFIIKPEWDVIESYQADVNPAIWQAQPRNAPAFWLLARDESKPDSAFPAFKPPHILVKWLDSTGNEIWSFEQSKLSP